jgi:hypothetical protein
VNNLFQRLPFKCNLQRYTADCVEIIGGGARVPAVQAALSVGLCTLNQVDP